MNAWFIGNCSSKLFFKMEKPSSKKKEKKKVTLQDLSQKNAWKVTIA